MATMMTNDIPDELKAKYLANDGAYCLYCGSDDLIWQSKEVEDYVTQRVICKTCHKSWQDMYGLVDVYIEEVQDETE